jgi:hypothetical protein
MSGPFQRPPHPTAWQRLKRWLGIWRMGAQIVFRRDSWAGAPAHFRGELEVLRVVASIFLLILIIVGIPLALCALLFFIFFLAGPLIAGFFFSLSRMEPASYPIAEIIFALLFTLFGLLPLLVAHRFQLGRTLNPPRRGLGLFISKGGYTFWQGTALCAIVAAQIALPAYAQDISILFWVVVGCLVLWPFLATLFTVLLRGVRRLARWRA